MSYPINYPTPQSANVQIFQFTGRTQSSTPTKSTWVKPQGASFVWFTLIGAGGGGDNTYGGSSGVVTNFMGPAFLIPDSLVINVGTPTAGNAGGDTTVVYQQKDGTGYTLLTAGGGSTGGATPSTMSPNYFTAMGFFQSVAGQPGGTAGVTASATTFLSGGSGGTTQANYGYSINGGALPGFFMMQPIIVGVGGSTSGRGGVGCGGGTNSSSLPGPGLAVIITW